MPVGPSFRVCIVHGAKIASHTVKGAPWIADGAAREADNRLRQLTVKGSEVPDGVDIDLNSLTTRDENGVCILSVLQLLVAVWKTHLEALSIRTSSPSRPHGNWSFERFKKVVGGE